VLHEVIVIAAAQDLENRPQRQPAWPAYADLKIDEVRLSQVTDDDVLSLMEVDIGGTPLVHLPE
jgi:hypothetical protein